MCMCVCGDLVFFFFCYFVWSTSTSTRGTCISRIFIFNGFAELWINQEYDVILYAQFAVLNVVCGVDAHAKKPTAQSMRASLMSNCFVRLIYCERSSFVKLDPRVRTHTHTHTLFIYIQARERWKKKREKDRNVFISFRNIYFQTNC